jgi:hypothetical protein
MREWENGIKGNLNHLFGDMKIDGIGAVGCLLETTTDVILSSNFKDFAVASKKFRSFLVIP